MNKNNSNIDYGKSWDEMKGNKTSKCVNGFWFHIEWNGDSGRDQHGRHWENRDKPTCKGYETIEAITGLTKQLIEATTKAKLI